jgi:putative transposase
MRETRGMPLWQSNYYEHIIRNEAELGRIQAYIQNNPIQWEADQLHPTVASNPFNQ